MRHLLLLISLLFGSLCQTLSAQISYPPDTSSSVLGSGVFDTPGSTPVYTGHCINMGTYPGVDPTGATDSTVGIQNAINYLNVSDQTDTPRQMTLYFPNGTYLISGTLDAFDSSGAPVYRLHFVGQSESGVIIKLGNAVSGFTNAASPKAMIKTETYGNETNTGFDNSISNMTIDTGTNNPGAIGIDFLGNNVANIRNVTITASAGSGADGLVLTREYPGPCMIESLTVNGFSTGVLISQEEYSMTFEGLTLNNQTSAGMSIYNGGTISIHGLISSNSNPVPVISNGSTGLLVVVGDATSPATATYTGGGITMANAITNSSTGTKCGGIFVRNFTSSNYALAVYNPNTGGSNTTGNAANGLVTEYETHPALTPRLAGDSTTSLDLPIQATPHFIDNNFADWYSVALKVLPDQSVPGGEPADESTQIQAAIDAAATAGKTTLFFPPGKYYLANTVYLHGSIRRVLGFGSILMPFVPKSGSGSFDSTHIGNLQPIISVGGGPLGDVTGSVEFDEFTVYATSKTESTANYCSIQQNTAQTLTLVDMEMNGGAIDSSGDLLNCAYQGKTGVGNLFIDDCDGMGWYFNHPGQNIWARQFDPEGDTGSLTSGFAAKITNTGSNLWILGLKTEDSGTLIESTAGASTEVLGAFLYSVGHTVEINNNVFDVQNSDFSGSYCSFGGTTLADYPNQVGQTEGTLTGTLYEYGSTSSPKAYLRETNNTYSMAPLVVAAPSLPIIPGIDIGTVGLTGTGTVAGNVFTVTGAGAGISGTTDAFHFCAGSVTGNCTVTARVTNFNYTTSDDRAGVMIRDTSAANSDMVMASPVRTIGGESGYFQIRSAAGASAVQAVAGVTPFPYWVRLQRVSNSFTSYFSPDGTTWTQVGEAHTFTMGSPALVGLAVTSGSTTQSCTATFDNVTITTP